MSVFVPGQRWFSSAEPELGLGTVMRQNGRSVQIVFTGTGVVRHYAVGSAPLARAAFRAGDRVRMHGQEVCIDGVDEHAGLLNYRCGKNLLSEGELDPEQPVSKADTRLLSGRVDRNALFEFRVECLARRAQAQAHPGFGVLGARIDPIPHQLRIAEQASQRRPVRFLLADEVGLGKTIEACLIVAQLLASGRAARTLVLVPESLLHQWFVELLRRFNLRFALFNEERCEAMEASSPGVNPFDDEQGVIAALDWTAHDERRRAQLLEAGWDVLVVDEAHHLSWRPDGASPEYRMVEALALLTPNVILLTATPEQLGRSGHFARLRLLDPARYDDLQRFGAESDALAGVSAAVAELCVGATPNTESMHRLCDLFGAEADSIPPRLAAIAAAEDAPKQALLDSLIDDLIDRHGTGRIMFRSRRALVGGFPRRIKHLDLLEVDDDPPLHGRLRAEFFADIGSAGHAEPEHDYAHDPRLDWLVAKLNTLAPAKCLLLCRSRAKVQALEEALRRRSGLAVARFHEDMNLLQRDRNAAFFAESAGARLLIASEIGAEGRNFQFAQHLLMWDLPLEPDLLEQRVGRLDRIGQRGDVHIHAVALANSPQAILMRWYDEALDAFEQVCPDGREMLSTVGAELVQLAHGDDRGDARDVAFADLVMRSRRRHQELSALIQKGRDHLLELASQRGSRSGALRAAILADDDAVVDDDYAWRLLEQFGIHHEPLARGIFLLDPEYLTLDAFAELKDGPRQATLERSHALSRDDLMFLRADHPMILSAQELLISGESGNACFLLDDALPARTVLLEAVFVLECIADRTLHVSRFVPPRTLRCIVDTKLHLRPEFKPSRRAVERAGDRTIDLIRFRKTLGTLVPPMLKRATEAAQADAKTAIARALSKVETVFNHEIARLTGLGKINPAVSPDEIARLKAEQAAVRAALPLSRPRLDALRLIASADFLKLHR